MTTVRQYADADHAPQPGRDGAGRLRPGLAGPAAQGQALPRHRAGAAGRRRLPGRGDRAGRADRDRRVRPVHPAAARRPAARLVRAARPAAGHPGQHRPAGAAELPGGELVPRHRVRRRALPAQRLLGGRAERAGAAGDVPLLPAAARAASGCWPATCPPRSAAALGGPDLPDDRPVPAAGRQVLAERLQVQQLLLPRGHHGRRRAAADLADVGARAGAAGGPGAVVRRAAADPAARRRPGPGGPVRGGAAALGRAGRTTATRCPGRGCAGRDAEPVPHRAGLPEVRDVHASTVDISGRPDPAALAGAAARAGAPPAASGSGCPRRPRWTWTCGPRCAGGGAASAGSPGGGRPARPSSPPCWPPRPRAPRCPPTRPAPGCRWPRCTSSSTTWAGSRRAATGTTRPPASCGWSGAGPPGEFLQRNYFLANYNLEQAGAVVVPAVRTGAVLDAVGDRGYRLVTALIGAARQTVYTAAAALGPGLRGGARLRRRLLRRGARARRHRRGPLLLMMVGHETARRGRLPLRDRVTSVRAGSPAPAAAGTRAGLGDAFVLRVAGLPVEAVAAAALPGRRRLGRPRCSPRPSGWPPPGRR